MSIKLNKDGEQKYFYTDGQHQYGPFSYEELQAQRISRETRIWFQGLDNWTPAKDIPELSELFATPPPFSQAPPPVNNPYTPPPPQQPYQQPYQQQQQTSWQQPPKNWLMESILATLFCCMPFGIAGIVHASKVESRFYSGDIDGAENAAIEAKKWTMISFWCGFAFIILYFFAIIIGIAAD